MKYLKPYKIFEKISTEIIEDIRDLLIDLEDQGFEIIYKPFKDNKNLQIKIINREKFTYSDIEFYIDRLVSYMDDEPEKYKCAKNNVVLKIDQNTFDTKYLISMVFYPPHENKKYNEVFKKL
jgi:hypothetical protein